MGHLQESFLWDHSPLEEPDSGHRTGGGKAERTPTTGKIGSGLGTADPISSGLGCQEPLTGNHSPTLLSCL